MALDPFSIATIGTSALGAIGSLFGGGGGISKKEQRNNFRWAVNSLADYRKQFEESPELAALTQALGNFSGDYQTYTPEFTAGLKARYAEDSQNGARNAIGQAWERSGAQGAYRDGSTRVAERNIGLRLGSDIAQGNRSVDEQARKSRSTDLATLGSLISALQSLRMGPIQAEASARLGAPVTQQGNAFGALLQGLGTVAAGIGTAQQKGGGSLWGNAFSGGTSANFNAAAAGNPYSTN